MSQLSAAQQDLVDLLHEIGVVKEHGSKLAVGSDHLRVAWLVMQGDGARPVSVRIDSTGGVEWEPMGPRR